MSENAKDGVESRPEWFLEMKIASTSGRLR